ncbi:hypothetical protein [Rubinisphaera margarita]|uniref:hypothetical protein n=1 Tax=Rubinisphaera margarita TaxID=2909586 RepID=UPI001EE7FF00|nr:hypothetical protein [Rubinisphaera margarita]MCG6154288.1 hypothetical protein [Rubinisphaera margarita]
MNYLVIHVDLEQIEHFDGDAIVADLEQTGVDVELEEGPPDEAYVDIFCTSRRKLLPVWQHVQKLLAANAALADASIVCCTGENGWDDYYLLHGAGEDETVDVLEA